MHTSRAHPTTQRRQRLHPCPPLPPPSAPVPTVQALAGKFVLNGEVVPLPVRESDSLALKVGVYTLKLPTTLKPYNPKTHYPNAPEAHAQGGRPPRCPGPPRCCPRFALARAGASPPAVSDAMSPSYHLTACSYLAPHQLCGCALCRCPRPSPAVLDCSREGLRASYGTQSQRASKPFGKPWKVVPVQHLERKSIWSTTRVCIARFMYMLCAPVLQQGCPPASPPAWPAAPPGAASPEPTPTHDPHARTRGPSTLGNAAALPWLGVRASWSQQG
jgi:hypothetical protein